MALRSRLSSTQPCAGIDLSTRDFDKNPVRVIMEVMDGELENNLTGKQYEKLADWGERVALIVFGSLVIQQLITRISLLVIGLGIMMTVVAYMFAYRALKKSK